MVDKVDYAGKRFLIADDEPFMLSIIERMLAIGNPRDILKVNSGRAALELLAKDGGKFDCIISDCNMKPVNGLQFLMAVRGGMNPRIPRDQAFIMLTGHGDVEVVKTAVMLDVSGYLVKPVAKDKLEHALARALTQTINIRAPEHYRSVQLAQVHSLDTSPGNPDGKPKT
jgi:two-component system sensor histidine kinase EvgS